MAITTFTELQASVANWLHRADLTALIPDFITLAEARMNGDLDSRQMQTRTTLTCDPNGTLTARYLTLPTDMLEMRRLANVTSDPATVLEYKSPDQLVADNSFLLSAGEPTAFTVIGGQVELSPAPDSAYSIELVYKQAIPALSDGNASNWVLASYPGLYLFATLAASAPFTQNEASVGMWEAKYAEQLRAINGVEWYSGSTLRVRAR